jgi:hypothetical protein
MVMRIKEHFLSLQRVGAQIERTAVTEFELGNLQLGALATQNHVVFAPVKLKRFSRRKR